MVGLYSSAGNFFFAWFVVWLVDLLFRNLMTTFSFVGKTLQAAQAMPMPVIALFILFAGFVVSPVQMGWMTFLFYIDPFAYGMRALALNEFLSPRYNFHAPGLAGLSGQTVGQLYLSQFGFPTNRAWQYGALGFLIGLLLVVMLLSVAAFVFIDYDKNIGSRRNNQNAALEAASAPAAATTTATVVPVAQQQAEVSKQIVVAIPTPGSPASAGTGDVAVAVAAGATSPSNPVVDSIPSAVSLRTLSSSASPASSTHPLHHHHGSHHNNKDRAWNSSIPFEKMTVAFQDICYAVKLPKAAGGGTKTLLHNVSGIARPGRILALMGASGAGKSTLLDVLTSRKTGGTMSGSILLNGFPKEEATFNRICGYVEQNDLHNPLTTVKEAVEFSAKLRLPSSTTPEQREAFVTEVLDLLELTDLADRMVGLPGNAEALAPAERKRLTIAVELASNAPVLAFDEPTTGLSSQAAAQVMRVLRRVAETGRCLIVTVHQPSAELFAGFSDLLLLQRGGYTAYSGPLGPRPGTSMAFLVDYLQGHFPGHPLPEGGNVAAWMLDLLAGVKPAVPAVSALAAVPAAELPVPSSPASSAASPATEPPAVAEGQATSPATASDNTASLAHIKIPADAAGAGAGGKTLSPSATAAGVGGSATMIPGPTLAATFTTSSQGIKLRADLEKYGKPLPNTTKVSFPSARARSVPVQIGVLTQRQWTSYQRNIGLNFGRFVALTFIQLLFGIVWFGAGNNNTTPAGVQTLIAAIFMTAAMNGMLNLNTALPPSLQQRPSFYRETSSRMYHPIAQTVSTLVVELPWMIFLLFCAVPISYFMLELSPAADVFFFHYLVTLVLAYTYFCLGVALANLMPTFEAAQALAGLLLPLFFLFGGLFSPPSQMVAGAQWFTYIDPISHAFAAIIPPHFYCVPTAPLYNNCPMVTVTTSTSSSTSTTYSFVSAKYEVYESSIWPQLGYLSIFVLVFGGVGGLATRYLRHINR